jgi:hypothetical protein
LILEAADEVLVHAVDSLQRIPVRVNALHLIAWDHERAAISTAARMHRHLRKNLRVQGRHHRCDHAPVHHVRRVRRARAAVARGLGLEERLELPQQLGTIAVHQVIQMVIRLEGWYPRVNARHPCSRVLLLYSDGHGDTQ